jgi:alpha/beta superfamily hydrolase
VAGYSFGSVVGGRAAVEEPGVRFYLGVAPPLALEDFSFLRSASCRIALIGGSYDQFGDPRRLDALAASLSSKPWVRVLDTDHFFAGAMEALAEACRDAIAWAQGTASL